MTATLLLTAVLGAPPHFDTEVVPVLTRAGCNAGACHGAAAGRGGFHLSLFGADPAADHEAIVHALEGRRVNLARPAESLVLAKPAGRIKHGGDKALPAGRPGAALLERWIASGAPRGPARRLTHFTVTVDRAVVVDDTPVTLKAVARFDGGADVDVTPWTVFTSSDPAAVTIDDQATASTHRRGRHVVIARFLDRVEPVRWTRPLGDRPVDLSDEPTNNFIDEEVVRTLTALRVPVSPQADDLAFLRRIRLDLTGTLPTPQEIAAFQKDPSRPVLVDRLLRSEKFAEYWTLRFARMLRVHTVGGEKPTLTAYSAFLKQALRDGTPLDRWARTLVTATGDSHTIGPANFARTMNDARGQAELVGRALLGARIQCANCHNHPLDRWTQDDYHGLAAVFAKIDRGRVVKPTAQGAVTNPRTGEPASPRIPGVGPLAGPDPVVGFADWLTAKENPYFAKAQVNRLWRAMFGRGLVEPADDLRATNPATHPELLDLLTADFVRNGYDIRHTLKAIALSRTYGRSATPVPGNETDDLYYARSYRRALDPEVLADAIDAVTGVPQSYAGHPAGTRAIAVIDPLSPAPSLDVLGRCARATACEESPVVGGLPAKLHLLNGALLNAKLGDRTGRLARMLDSGKSRREIVIEFYLRGFGRPPTEKELAGWLQRIETGGRPAVEDFVWGLLNSQGFQTNH